MMRRLGHIIERIADVGGYISGWLVFLMMLLVVFEVFMRYVVHRPPMIADEFSGYLLVAVSFVGMAYTWKMRGHIRITALVDKVPPRVSAWLRLFTMVLAFAFAVILTRTSYSYLAFSFKLHKASATWLHIPLQGPQMALPIGFTLLGLLLVVDIIKAIMNLKPGLDAQEKPR